MKIIPTLTATALLALLAAPAFAQTLPADSTPAAPVNAMPADSTPPMAPMAPMAPSATDAGAPVSATVQTVTNGPVADTPEMRAKYKPLSHAGRHTKPAGN